MCPTCAIVDGAGNILYRQGIPGQPGTFEPPVTVNPGNPSRDIAWVPDTNQGPVLASVDAHDNAISLYAYRDGGFVLVGSLATGFAAGADHRGRPQRRRLGRPGGPQRRRRDAVGLLEQRIRGPCNRASPPFLPPVTLPVGLGVSDVEAVDTTGSGRLDLVVTNKLTGQVSVMPQPG